MVRELRGEGLYSGFHERPNRLFQRHVSASGNETAVGFFAQIIVEFVLFVLIEPNLHDMHSFFSAGVCIYHICIYICIHHVMYASNLCWVWR